jgi:citrate lyase beta subunit
MLDSYFFIPADKPKYYDKIESLAVDYIVFDLEDAVTDSNKKGAFDLLMSYPIQQNHFIRFPLTTSVFTTQDIAALSKKFEGRIVAPKIENAGDLKPLLSCAENISWDLIILLESPKALVNLSSILAEHHSITRAVGFGSHDFCASVGMKHTSELLLHYKQQIILQAKVFGVDYLDGVDTQLNDFTNFKNEAKLAFECGASGKFLIHPAQIAALNEVEFLTPEEIARLEKVYALILEKDHAEIDIIKMDGMMFERPHFHRIIKYVEKIIQKRSRNLIP